MRSTISDVAKLAGVSSATVSNVLSGKKYVSPQLKKMVEDAVEELNYRPNRIARGLKNRRTSFIGLMVPDITNPFFAEVARGVESVTLAHDYQLFLCNTDGDKLREDRIMGSFVAHNVEGVVNVAPRTQDAQIAAGLEGVPQVVVDRPYHKKNPNISSIYVDNFSGSSMLAEYLLSKGFKRYACLSGPEEVLNVKKRLDGFIQTLEKGGIRDDDRLIEFGEFKYESGHLLMQKILESDFSPDVVFASNDLMAWGAMEAIQQYQLSRGVTADRSDIAVAGFDNIYFSQFLSPTLTTVDQPKFDMGRIAMEVLLDMIKNGESSPFWKEPVVLGCELIPRNSA